MDLEPGGCGQGFEFPFVCGGQARSRSPRPLHRTHARGGLCAERDPVILRLRPSAISRHLRSFPRRSFQPPEFLTRAVHPVLICGFKVNGIARRFAGP